jgi:hypothetical protein
MKFYFVKVALRGVSPMVWRRLRIPGNASLAMLHQCIQIINGWDDFNLHQFHIYGKDFGINYVGGLSYSDNVHTVLLDSFNFDVGDKFTYEYNFFEHIMHDISIESILELPIIESSIVCLRGSGMPGVTKYDVMRIEHKILKKIVSKKGKLTVNDVVNFKEALNHVKFNKNQVNISLASIEPK